MKQTVCARMPTPGSSTGRAVPLRAGEIWKSCEPSPSLSELIFLGTGCSTGVPVLSCVLRPKSPPCETCHRALSSPPETNKNYRCTPSLLIRFAHEDGRPRCILIDAGKTFREQVIRWFPKFGVTGIDSLLLTHHHADAILGLDDVRDVQPRHAVNGGILPLPVYLSERCMVNVANQFPYLAKPRQQEAAIRRVSQLDWRIMEESPHETYDVEGLMIRPLPVMHGEDTLSLGFLLGEGRQRVAYISDVSRLLPETERKISATTTTEMATAMETGMGMAMEMVGPEVGGVDLLILDCLYRSEKHPTHVSLPESLEIVRRLRPERTLLIGMSHQIEHELISRELETLAEREGIHVALAYDGLCVKISL